jgi:hypothetical protein
VQKLETGGRELSKPVMERLARELGVPEADLLASADGGLSRGERALVDSLPPRARAAARRVRRARRQPGARRGDRARRSPHRLVFHSLLL